MVLTIAFYIYWLQISAKIPATQCLFLDEGLRYVAIFKNGMDKG